MATATAPARTFSDLAAALDAAMADVTQARAAVEKTEAAATAARERLSQAVATTRTLQAEFRAKVDDVIGDASPGRVRVG